MHSTGEDIDEYRTISVRHIRAYSKKDRKEYCFDLTLRLRPKRQDGSDTTRLASCIVDDGLSRTRFKISGLDDIHALSFGMHYIDNTLRMLQEACEVWIDDYRFDVGQQSAFFMQKQ